MSSIFLPFLLLLAPPLPPPPPLVQFPFLEGESESAVAVDDSSFLFFDAGSWVSSTGTAAAAAVVTTPDSALDI
jgi:hypothetical protein